MDYYEQKTRQLDAATSRAATLTGTLVSTPEDHPFMRGGFLPLNPCACVTEPCHCDGYDHGNTIVWIPRSLILDSRDTGRHSTDGESIVEYRLEDQTQVFLEKLRPVNAADALALLGLERGRGSARG